MPDSIRVAIGSNSGALINGLLVPAYVFWFTSYQKMT
jgi:hypothetical protein